MVSGCAGCALPRLELQNNKQKQAKEEEEQEQKRTGKRTRVVGTGYPLPGTRYTGLGDYPAAREVN